MFVNAFVFKTLLLTANLFGPFLRDDVFVQLSHGGQVRGTTLMSTERREFYAFRGIPYAEPPVGELRFKEPIPKAGWRGTPFDATVEGPICVQWAMPGGGGGVEDCLVLSVYTPELPKVENVTKRAVMVYIHGGSFLNGAGTYAEYPPQHFMDFDIVFVTINYRLGALGFLSTGDSSSPGNYGMLDQRMALLWVRYNIGAFGGDKDSVTIIGHSAGGASITLPFNGLVAANAKSSITLSSLRTTMTVWTRSVNHQGVPMFTVVIPQSPSHRGKSWSQLTSQQNGASAWNRTLGLFHRGIAMSGSSLNPWAFEPSPLYWAKQLAMEVGCPEDPTTELVSCLRNKPAEDVNLGMGHDVPLVLYDAPFSPCIDGYFLPAHPRTLMSSSETVNSVPVVMGITEAEETFSVLRGAGEDVRNDEFIKDKFNNSISNLDEEIIQMIRNRYLAPIDPNNDMAFIRAFVRALSDGLYNMNHYEEVMLLSEAGLPVYSYSYNYLADAMLQYVRELHQGEYAVAELLYSPGHGDDLCMIFPSGFANVLNFTQNDKKMRKTLLRLWTNFAKSGNPDPKNEFYVQWKPSTSHELHIHNLDLNLTSKVHTPKEDELYHFWTKDIHLARMASKELKCNASTE